MQTIAKTLLFGFISDDLKSAHYKIFIRECTTQLNARPEILKICEVRKRIVYSTLDESILTVINKYLIQLFRN